jgi:3-oxoacyl-[acyl-carrier protein] reductase
MEEKKVAIITGGSRGIGKEIAKKFAKENYNLVINYVSEKTNTEELKKKFEAFGAEVLFIKTNVTSYEECEKMAKDAINQFGKIDVLVNNAGVTKDSLLLRMKEEDFDTVINVNLKGTFNVTKACIPYMMKKKSGKIVNISSVVGISGNSGQANYAASKAGIIGFTKSVAKELASRNILANCVAPGYIATDMTNGLSDAVKESINNQIPLKRVGMPEEVAKAVYFLAGEENSYITGQVLNVDGGMLI